MILYYQPKWLPYLEDIDIKSHKRPWCQDDWKNIDKYMVSAHAQNLSDTPTGFSICETVDDTLVILRLAVHPDHRRKGIGSELLARIQYLARKRNKSIKINVRYCKDSLPWLRNRGFVIGSHRGADLQGENLEDFDFRGVDLSGANLRGAYLSGADFRGADLRGADLRHTDISDADFRGANLNGTILEGMKL